MRSTSVTAAAATLVALATVVGALPSRLTQTVFQADQFDALLAPFEGVRVPGFDLDLDALRLVQFGQDEQVEWLSNRQLLKEKARGRRYMDITETPELASYASFDAIKPVYPIPNSTHVAPIAALLSTAEPRANLEKFTSFRTRYYRSETGKQSTEWLLTKIESYIAASSKDMRDRVSVKLFAHTWTQSSIILKIEPIASGKGEPITIVGAHLDSTNQLPWLPAPGADDDGSGTVTILEALRVLLASGYVPATPVEFMWFSAEEGGLLGSQAIAQSYAAAGAKVKAMLHLDVVAWLKKGTKETIGVITDFVSPELTEFNIALIKKHLDIPPAVFQCGYACSDHASFLKAGFPSSSSAESTMADTCPYMHSTSDRLDAPEFSFDHALQFSRMVVAFVVELGGWTGKD